MEEVEGDGVGGGVPLLVLPAKPHLLTKETEMRLMSDQPKHNLGGREGGKEEKEEKEGGRDEGRKEGRELKEAVSRTRSASRP